MRLGAMRDRIRLETRVTTRNAIGQQLESWLVSATVWGDVRYLSGLEAIRADAPRAVAKASIRIHYRPGVAANMRAVRDVPGGEVFDVEAVLRDRSRAYLDLACSTGANNG